jgi:hypothetical protein
MPDASALAQFRDELFQPDLVGIFYATRCGSDEQRGVFAESHLVSLIRGERWEEARTALSEHMTRRPMTAVERRWAAMI